MTDRDRAGGLWGLVGGLTMIFLCLIFLIFSGALSEKPEEEALEEVATIKEIEIPIEDSEEATDEEPVTAVIKEEATVASDTFVNNLALMVSLKQIKDEQASEIARLKAELEAMTAERDAYREAYETYDSFLDDLIGQFEDF